MNRLTKHINLVLISSSLILHGCRGWHEEEKPKEGEKQAPAASQPRGPISRGVRGYHYFHGGSGAWGGSGGGRPGVRTSSGGRTSAGISARGGFGASAHGVAS